MLIGTEKTSKEERAYRVCKELNQLTPQIVREWGNEIKGDIYEVKRQILLRCPKTDELVPESKCLSCSHYFGQSSDRAIYCLPDTERNVGARSKRKRIQRRGIEMKE